MEKLRYQNDYLKAMNQKLKGNQPLGVGQSQSQSDEHGTQGQAFGLFHPAPPTTKSTSEGPVMRISTRLGRHTMLRPAEPKAPE